MHFGVLGDSGGLEETQPIMAFASFLEANGVFADEVGATLTSLCFLRIRPDTRRRPQELAHKNAANLSVLQPTTQLHRTHRERKRAQKNIPGLHSHSLHFIVHDGRPLPTFASLCFLPFSLCLPTLGRPRSPPCSHEFRPAFLRRFCGRTPGRGSAGRCP